MSSIPILFELMEQHNITQKKLSADLGISQGNISDWKSGRSSPSMDKLVKLADYFNVSTDYLVGKINIKNKSASNNDTDLDNVFFSLAKDAQENGLDPDDLRVAIETIKQLRKK